MHDKPMDLLEDDLPLWFLEHLGRSAAVGGRVEAVR